jgi:hypothetical protein
VTAFNKLAQTVVVNRKQDGGTSADPSFGSRKMHGFSGVALGLLRCVFLLVGAILLDLAAGHLLREAIPLSRIRLLGAIIGLTLVLVSIIPLPRHLRASIASRINRPAVANSILLVFATLVSAIALEQLALGIEKYDGLQADDASTRLAHKASTTTISDDRLSLRLRGGLPGHDSAGWRNPAAPQRAEIIAIGDSQTWGINATWEETWPERLHVLSNRSVYSMALGGYSASQYLFLAEDALRFEPKDVIVALYFGNDFFEVFYDVYRRERLRDLRRDGISLASLPLDPADDPVFSQHNGFIDAEAKAVIEGEASTEADAGIGAKRVFSVLASEYAVTRLLMKARHLPGVLTWPEARNIAAVKWARTFPQYGALYSDGDVTTVLTPFYRLATMDQSNPTRAEGVRLTKEIVLRIKRTLEARGVRFWVLLIPTKELVFAEADSHSLWKKHDAWRALKENETSIRNELLQFFHENKILCIDSLGALVAAARRHENIYRLDDDGHPLPKGYDVIARTVDEELRTSQ